jgi:hypothetical protein
MSSRAVARLGKLAMSWAPMESVDVFKLVILDL